ncbi:hypothetical protein JKP88DRAFT_246247 [Tribonema minus]|uniref:Polymorphic outer membrane protein n=1 Tax=Tribonema minus TaxID=303371 RepID=A0A835YTW6_9STRA|nr:hypothetical protein JKP88DRAFT_246247 [Tribonema minus]
MALGTGAEEGSDRCRRRKRQATTCNRAGPEVLRCRCPLVPASAAEHNAQPCQIEWCSTRVACSLPHVERAIILDPLPERFQRMFVMRRKPQQAADAPSEQPAVPALSRAGALHIESLKLTGGIAQSGGAISAQGPAVISLTSCELAGNRATSFGGALWLGDGAARAALRGCALRGNAAGCGGAVYAKSPLFVAASVFSNNTAVGYRSIAAAAVVAFGGAIVAKPGALRASDTAFDANAAAITYLTGGEPWSPGDAATSLEFTGGGAVFVWDVATPVVLRRCTFSRNAVRVAAPPPQGLPSTIPTPTQQFGGGALWSSAARLRLRGCSFEANVVDNGAVAAAAADDAAAGTSDGGAVYVEDGAVAVAACNFTRNSTAAPAAAVAHGGAGHARNSTARISGSTFSGNVAANPALFAARRAAARSTPPTSTRRRAFCGNCAHNGGGLYMSADAQLSGAAAAAPSVSLSIRACRLSDNWASVFGGAAQLAFYAPPPRTLPRTTLRVARSYFKRNSAYTGGALQVSAPVGSNAVIVLSDVTFARNDASFSGALDIAAYRHRYSGASTPLEYAAGTREPGLDVRLARCRFLSNAAASGGALTLTAAATDDTLTADGCTFSGNAADTRHGIAAVGGAMLLACAAALRNCAFDGNAAHNGGGAIAQLYTSSQQLSLHACAFANNTSGAYGGAVYTLGAVTARNSTFRGNAALAGGALWSSFATLDGCAFDANTTNSGGAVLAQHALQVPQSAAPSSYTSNAATSAGGAIFYVGADTLEGPVPAAPSRAAFARSAAGCCYSATNATHDCVDVHAAVGALDTCCAAGMWQTGSRMDCTLPGTALANVPLLAGYWRATPNSTLVRPCFSDGACRGGDAGSDVSNYCAEGYEGPCCAVCAPGYYAGVAATCSQCSDKWKGGVIVTALIVAVILGVLLWASVACRRRPRWRRACAAAARRALGKLRIPVIVYQASSTYSCCRRATGRSKKRSAPCDDAHRSIHVERCSVLLVVAWFPIRWLKFGCCALDIFDKPLRALAGGGDVLEAPPAHTMRIISQCVSATGARLPPVYEAFVAGLSVLGLDVAWFLCMACLVRVNYYARLLIATLAPLPVLALIGASYLWRVRHAPPPLLPLPRRPRPQRRGAQQAEGGAAADDGGGVMAAAAAQQHLRLALGFTFLIYSAVSTVVFQASCTCFACDDLTDAGARYLRADYSLSCDTPRHAHYAAYAAVQECGRRLLLTGVMVFVAPGTPGQLAAGCVFAVLSLLALALCAPHADALDGQLYTGGCVVIFLTALAALLYRLDAALPDPQDRSVVGAVLFALNVLLAAAAAAQVLAVIAHEAAAAARRCAASAPRRRHLSAVRRSSGSGSGAAATSRGAAAESGLIPVSPDAAARCASQDGVPLKEGEVAPWAKRQRGLPLGRVLPHSLQSRRERTLLLFG